MKNFALLGPLLVVLVGCLKDTEPSPNATKAITARVQSGEPGESSQSHLSDADAREGTSSAHESAAEQPKAPTSATSDAHIEDPEVRVAKLIEALRGHYQSGGQAISPFRVEVAKALGKIGPPAIPQLLARIDDPDSFTRCGVFIALGEMKLEAKEAAPRMLEVLQYRGSSDIIHLILRQPPRDVDAYLSVDPQGLHRIADGLTDDFPTVRKNTKDLLYQIGKPSVPILTEILQADDQESRLAAARVLARFGTDIATDVREAFLNQSVDCRRRASEALRQAVDATSPQDAKTWRKLLHELEEGQPNESSAEQSPPELRSPQSDTYSD